MSSDLSKDLLAVLASHTDVQLNERFQQLLDDPKTIKYAQLFMNKHSSFLEKIRQRSDTLALQLNLPTKDDVANVANLAKQLEEKLDQIENQLHQLTKNQATGEQRNENAEKNHSIKYIKIKEPVKLTSVKKE